MRRLLFILAVSAPLLAQMPEGWNKRPILGEGMPLGDTWYGAGLWAADRHGPRGTFIDSLGLGNALTGTGFHLEAGAKLGKWDIAIETLGNRDTEGSAYMTLYRGHITHRSEQGWQFGLEQEPLVWGYGLNGGYLLGEAGRPFPRLRLESPMRPVRFFGIPLGTWGFQAFMGRLENDRVLSDSIQDPSWRQDMIASQGDPQAPMFSGYRLQAKFGEDIDYYMNFTNLWSGTLNGRGMTNGYSASEYLTAMFGLKDQLAEHEQAGAAPVNDARSASNLDLGIRIRMRRLSSLAGANKAWFYVTRGSKGYYWPIGEAVRRPFYSLGQDLQHDTKNIAGFHPGMAWNKQLRYWTPNLVVPNETVGLLFSWNRVRLGVEYCDTVNSTTTGHRSFAHGQYLTGFYYHGDPLGNAMGGEAITTTARLEVDFTEQLTGTTWVHTGHRPFRDNVDSWTADHPGQSPTRNHFTGIQQALTWKMDPFTTLDIGASWQHQSAVDNVIGNRQNSYRWFADLVFRWP